MITKLETVRDAMALISGVASCKIGLEANITPNSYPLIRIVPQRIFRTNTPYNNRTAECFVYFGVDKTEAKTGLESVYRELLVLEQGIIAVIKAQGDRYVETLMDEDEVAGQYKVAAIRCELVGIE